MKRELRAILTLHIFINRHMDIVILCVAHVFLGELVVIRGLVAQQG
jgi:hypothetical protein